MIISISDGDTTKKIFKGFNLPGNLSHKGHNGKLLIIGGSSLFHAASLWAAEIASHIVDMVHYASTVENERIFHELKKKFRNGMIVPNENLDEYISQDDAVLVGPGMMREGQEGKHTRALTKRLMEKYPEKRFVFDAGALQMMEKEWLLKMKVTPIITPHQKEFEGLFGVPISKENNDVKRRIVKETAKKYRTVIILKAITDFVSDGKEIFEIVGGNAGLTKGGTGDLLAGLAASFYTKNSPLESALFSSVLLKKTAERLFDSSGYWYNVSDIIKKLPEVIKSEILDKI